MVDWLEVVVKKFPWTCCSPRDQKSSNHYHYTAVQKFSSYQAQSPRPMTSSASVKMEFSYTGVLELFVIFWATCHLVHSSFYISSSQTLHSFLWFAERAFFSIRRYPCSAKNTFLHEKIVHWRSLCRRWLLCPKLVPSASPSFPCFFFCYFPYECLICSISWGQFFAFFAWGWRQWGRCCLTTLLGQWTPQPTSSPTCAAAPQSSRSSLAEATDHSAAAE